MHHALVISEILGSIFKYTDSSSNIACALVCKLWQENALDALWYRVDRLECLLRLLGPLGEIHPQLLSFMQTHIASERWDRFSFYSERVRCLEVADKTPEIHSQTFTTLSLSRPVLHLLPNLTHLTWKKDPTRPRASLLVALLFLTPGLKSLSVETGHHSEQGDLSAIDNFFKHVMDRCPRIEHLELRSDIPFHDLGPALSNFLVGLPNLRSVLLSDALLTSDVITALSKCTFLESIRMTDPFETTEVGDGADDLQNFMPALEPGSFPCLRELEILAHLWNVERFLQTEIPAARLRRLVVRTLIQEDSGDIGTFFVRVVEACPNIEVLALSVQYGGIDENSPSVPFSCLEPLLGCKLITTFTLNMPLPLDIDDADATRLASSWPRLEDLRLNPSPAIQRPDDKHLTFSALTAFSEHCALLRVLELPIESHFIPPPASRKLFPHLDMLVFGLMGSTYVAEDLALYLTDITPAKCQISGVPYAFSNITAHVRAHANIAEMKLKKVLMLLPTLRAIHAQYQGRLRALEAQVESLTQLVVAAGL